MDRMAEMGCVFTGGGPGVLHHLMRAPGKKTRRDHRYIVCLDDLLHRTLHDQVGDEVRFFTDLGKPDIYIWALEQWNESVRLYNG